MVGGQIGLTPPRFKHSDVAQKGSVKVNSTQDETFAGEIL